METHKIIEDANSRMDKGVKVTQEELNGVRTGRASINLLDRVMVDYYGTKTPLNQVANVNAPEAQLLTIQPWDKSQIPVIEKVIQQSDIGLTPSNDGNLIRLSVPPLTEERRKELVKLVHTIAEEGRVAARNIRRDANEHLKKEQKEGNISEDDYYRLHDRMQKITDDHVKKIDEMMKNKENEIMEV